MSRFILVPLAVVISVLAVAQVGRGDDKQETARLQSEESKIKAELQSLVERIEALSEQLDATRAERRRVEEKAKRGPSNPESAPLLAELRASLSRKAEELQVELGKHKLILQAKTRQLAELGQRTTEKARDEFNRGPGEEISRRIQQLQEQLAEATEAGKKEIADRLKKELRDYAVETATEKMQQVRHTAETAVKQQIEAMENRIRQLREQGKPEIAERLAAELKRMIQSRRSAEEARKQQEVIRPEIARRAGERRERPEAVARQQAEAPEQQSRHAQQRRTDERRVFAQRADQLEREINRLREQGREDAAEQLANELRDLTLQQRQAPPVGDRDRAAFEQQAAQRHEAAVREHAEQQQREIARLRESGHHEEAERLQQQLRRMMEDPRLAQQAPRNREPQNIGPEQRGELERRVHHLRAAAENLAAIGMHDLVERLNREAEEIERTLHDSPPPGGPPHEGIMEAMHHEFQTIHQRLDEVTRRVEELTRTRRDRDEP